jgi:hypothetical protein
MHGDDDDDDDDDDDVKGQRSRGGRVVVHQEGVGW